MSYNGSGTFVINSTGQPIVTGTVISSTMMNALTADLATGLTAAFTKTGESTPTANLPIGGYKLTNIGAATTTGDALSYGRAATVTTLNATTSLTVAALSGILTTSAGLVAVATAGTDYAKPNTASTWTAKQTFNGSATTLGIALKNASEPATVSATVATGTIDYNILTQSILYYTSNASGNWTTNLRGDGSTTLASMMATGDAVTAVFMVTQGGTAYYNNVVQVDGTVTGVTTKWLSIAPTAGVINSVNAYTYVIVKTAATPTYTVFASLASFV